MRQARLGDAVLPPAMHGGERRFGEPGDGSSAAELIDYQVSKRSHEPNDATIATLKQGKSCESRDCDNRSFRLSSGMAFEEINAWIRGKRGRASAVAKALGLTADKVSKSQSGVRDWTAEEVDRVRQMMAEEIGEPTAPVRSVPLLGDVPGGNLREAIKNAKGTVPSADPSLPARAFALIVKGDSMDLIAEEGTRIFLDPDDLDLFPGRLYVVLSADGESTFKRYLADPARLVPVSSNKRHKEIPVGREQFTVIARVFGGYTRY